MESLNHRAALVHVTDTFSEKRFRGLIFSINVGLSLIYITVLKLHDYT